MSEWRTSEEILEEHDITPRTLRRWCQHGKFEKLKTKDGLLYREHILGELPPRVEDARDWLTDFKYIYDKERDVYVTYLKCKSGHVEVSGPLHRAMKAAYSNWAGTPSTINEISRKFKFPRKWFLEYKTIHEWFHDSAPVTREELLEQDPEDLAEDIYFQKSQRLVEKFEEKKWKKVKDAARKWLLWEEYGIRPIQELIEKTKKSVTIEFDLPTYWNDNEDVALVISPADFHFGKYAWSLEVGEQFDRKIARRRLFSSTQDILSRLPSSPTEIISVIGSDWFHVDGDVQATTRGTPQDCDGTPAQIYIEGCRLMVEYVELLRAVCPKVILVLTPGNHDQGNSISLAMYLKAWYRNEDVEIRDSYESRQYYRYGKTLMGFTHGDGPKLASLGPLMAHEARKLWGKTDHHVWFCGASAPREGLRRQFCCGLPTSLSCRKRSLA